jgi:hypothetical protein
VVGRVAQRGEVALEVDADDGVPLGLGHPVQERVAQDARVVDEDVEPPVLVDGLLDEAPGTGEVGDIVRVVDPVPGLDVVDDDRGAECPEQLHVLRPDAVPGAGDHAHAVTQHAPDRP